MKLRITIPIAVAGNTGASFAQQIDVEIDDASVAELAKAIAIQILTWPLDEVPAGNPGEDESPAKPREV